MDQPESERGGVTLSDGPGDEHALGNERGPASGWAPPAPTSRRDGPTSAGRVDTPPPRSGTSRVDGPPRSYDGPTGTDAPAPPWRDAGTPPPAPPPSGRGGRGGGGDRRGPSWAALATSVLGAIFVAVALSVALVQGLDRPGNALTGDQSTQEEPAEATPARDAPASTVLPSGSLVADVAEQVLPSVARVDVRTAQGEGSGSAVVYSADGQLVTNNHVVGDAQDVRVTLADGETYDAEVLGADPVSDVAVIKIDATDLQVPAFADGLPRVGDAAIAFGSPFGLDATVTQGIVSAEDRQISAPGEAAPLIGMLQTDAAINPGNSGGPLVDDRGEVIGINTAIYSQAQQNSGIGFAIPVVSVLKIADQLIDEGEVEYAFLGVSTQPIVPGEQRGLGLDSPEGAQVVRVEQGSAAAKAGIEEGDVIVELNGTEVKGPGDLFAAVIGAKVGDEVDLIVVRDGERETLTAELDSRPDEPVAEEQPAPGQELPGLPPGIPGGPGGG